MPYFVLFARFSGGFEAIFTIQKYVFSFHSEVGRPVDVEINWRVAGRGPEETREELKVIPAALIRAWLKAVYLFIFFLKFSTR